MCNLHCADTALIRRNSEIPDDLSILDYLKAHLSDRDFVFERPFSSVSVGRKAYALNLTSSIILDEILRGSDQAAIATALKELFEVSLEQATADVAAVLDELTGLGVLGAKS